MIRWALFVLLAAAVTAYAYWIYLRVDLQVQSGRRLAALRAVVLVTVLLMLFDVRIPSDAVGGAPTEWALLDASLSMGATGGEEGSAWDAASNRAAELEAAGWNVVTFGSGTRAGVTPARAAPVELASMLAPALDRAAEAGARRIVVLSDFRLQDRVAVRSALETLPLQIELESFGGAVVNAGVVRLDVPDFAQPDESVTAEIEVHGGDAGDTLTVSILEEGTPVASAQIPAPLPGLRARATVEVPPPIATGRVRYSARVTLNGDAFPDDDAAIDYASVGYEEGALVLVSLSPDWEPRYLLPVLEEVTGLPVVGFLRAGPDRFVRAGRALDRGSPADSASVGSAVGDAVLVVVHGLDGDADPWARGLVERAGRGLLMPTDARGAAAAGLRTGAARPGEWYVSADVPPSPIAGALAGVALQGLPPLTSVLVPDESEGSAPLLLQLRGAGSPEAALHLADRASGRVAVTLASGFWRWAAREVGREPYRRLWSGVVGWLLADQAVLAAESRPVRWVFPRAEPVTWSVPSDGSRARLSVQLGDSVVADTSFAGGGTHSLGRMSPGSYTYTVTDPADDTVGVGRFDVSASTEEMLPVPDLPSLPLRAGVVGPDAGGGRPLRTLPWPYLLVISLLCIEWIVRRRSGLR